MHERKKYTLIKYPNHSSQSMLFKFSLKKQMPIRIYMYHYQMEITIVYCAQAGLHQQMSHANSNAVKLAVNIMRDLQLALSNLVHICDWVSNSMVNAPAVALCFCSQNAYATFDITGKHCKLSCQQLVMGKICMYLHSVTL